MKSRSAKFNLGEIVKHRIYEFRGVVFDVDPVFANSDDWLQAIPENIRPDKNQPFYHLLAENDDIEYIAYVSEQNLVAEQNALPLRHPQLDEHFMCYHEGAYLLHEVLAH